MALHSLEQLGGHTFLVCELLEGANLAEELTARGRFAAKEVAAVAEDLVGALAYALGRGVVHRDVKLQNVMRSASGTIKLTDFGLAKLAAAEESLTAVGNVVGTIAYLAPELLRGESASFRSDMYALGVLVRSLLRGSLAMQYGTSVGDTPATADAGPLAPILAKLLDPDPRRRYADYAALLADLLRARNDA
jgi:serine/threonine protein kinase